MLDLFGQLLVLIGFFLFLVVISSMIYISVNLLLLGYWWLIPGFAVSLFTLLVMALPYILYKLSNGAYP